MKIGYHAEQHLPTYPVYLSGYPRAEKTSKVHLAPEIAALTLKFDKRQIVLCIIDTILISNEMMHYIRKNVAGRSHVKYEDIHISATHTHSAPCIYTMNIPDPPMDEKWLQVTLEKSVQVILKSMQAMQECDCYFHKTLIDGIYGNRNEIHGIENKEAYIFSLCSQGKLLGKFINLSCHNTINSTDNSITSDLFGGIRKELEKDGCFYMIANGISGDISTRHYRQGTDCKEVDRISNLIANQLKQEPLGKKVNTEHIITDLVCTHAYQNIRKNPHIQQQIAMLEQKEKDHTLAGWDDFTLESYRIRKRIGEFYHFLETGILKIDTMIFITIPGEAVTYFDQYFRALFPSCEFIFLGTTDGYVGYLVPEDDEEDFESQMAEVAVADVWVHMKRIKKHLEAIIST